MVIRSTLSLLALSSLLCSVSSAVTVQSDTDVLADGSAFLWVEAESAFELGGGNPQDAEVGFILVDKNDPIKTIEVDANGNNVIQGGLDVLPEDTNASGGGAIFQQLGGGGNAKWQVEFAIPATYYLYMHYSFYNRDNNTNYGNEDSIYVPPAFNLEARNGWIGFEGINELGEPKTGDSNRDGWIPLGKDIKSEGGIDTHNSTDENFWEGDFHWALMDVTVDVDANDAFVDDFGHSVQYEVAEGDVGTVLDFEITTREPYGVIDGLLFSTSNMLLDDYLQEDIDAFFLNPEAGPVPGDFDASGVLDLPDVNMLSAEIAGGGQGEEFDLNGDTAVDVADLNVWVKDLRKTWIGDANLDGEFESGDFVTVFTAGLYNKEETAGWAQGDWNADLRFESGDFVAAFTDGGYNKGPVAAAAAVPEPSALVLLSLGLLMLTRGRKN